jgi:gliding motility-associated protein GldL
VLYSKYTFWTWTVTGKNVAVGFLTEAFIFALSAFEPVDNELDWSLVYPELANWCKGPAKRVEAASDSQGMLSQN